MDEEEINNRLSARINEVFDNYEDTTADEGWALLRQKYPEEKKDRGLIWLWYGAAAILLLAFGLWFMQDIGDVKKPVAVNVKPVTKPHTATQTPQPGLDSSQNAVEGKQVVKAEQQPLNKPSGRPIIATAKTKVNNANVNQPLQKPSPNQPAVVQVPPSSITSVSTSNNYIANKPTGIEASATSSKDDKLKVDSATKASVAIVTNSPKPAVTKSTVSSAEALEKLFAETAKNPSTAKLAAKKDKKPVIGLYAATYFNYAEGSDNKVNLGAGLSSDFSITQNLKLSTGLSIAQNTLNYDYRKNNGDNALYSAAPADNAFGGLAAVSSYSASVPQNYKASLIGLDIPVNIKYILNPKKDDTYISAGLSSGTFINQTYTLDYTVARQTQQTTTTNNFGDFYFAKTLNVSFGVGYPLGKNNRLVVEPFLKYPLSGLGSQQIKFGAGGINLKLNFSAPKK